MMDVMEDETLGDIYVKQPIMRNLSHYISSNVLTPATPTYLRTENSIAKQQQTMNSESSNNFLIPSHSGQENNEKVKHQLEEVQY